MPQEERLRRYHHQQADPKMVNRPYENIYRGIQRHHHAVLRRWDMLHRGDRAPFPRLKLPTKIRRSKRSGEYIRTNHLIMPRRLPAALDREK